MIYSFTDEYAMGITNFNNLDVINALLLHKEKRIKRNPNVMETILIIVDFYRGGLRIQINFIIREYVMIVSIITTTTMV